MTDSSYHSFIIWLIYYGLIISGVATSIGQSAQSAIFVTPISLDITRVV